MKRNFFLKSWNFSGQFKQHFQQKLWKFSEMGSGTRSLSALANQKLRPVKVAKTIFCTFCEFSMSNVRVKIIYELKYTSDYIEIYKCAMGYSSLYPKLKRALKKNKHPSVYRQLSTYRLISGLITKKSLFYGSIS